MSTVLVVDDSRMEQEIAGNLLQQLGNVDIVYAGDGRAALEIILEATPELVVTDLQMPGMGGLELVTELRTTHPSLPVILMTAFGSEDTAAEALRMGAASYVPKSNLARDLAPTVARTLELWRAKGKGEGAQRFLTETVYRFVLDNDPANVSPLVARLAEEARRHGICAGDESMRLSVALDEAISNALHHGNLEVQSHLREEGMVRYLEMLEKRRHMAPYNARRIHVEARFTADAATYVIRDDGSGFDHAAVPDPTAPENLLRASGRGMVLIRTFMDDVHLNDVGNEITMVKRRG